MDLHHKHVVFEARTARGGLILHRDLPTERSPLIEAIRNVPGPKGVVIEEGGMADWAMHEISPAINGAYDPKNYRSPGDPAFLVSFFSITRRFSR